MKKISVICMFLAFMSFYSCSARIEGSLSQDGSVSVSVSSSLGARISGLIRTMTAAAGQTGGNIIDGEAISRSMNAAPGISSVSFRNTNPSSIEGTVNISRISDFLASAGGHGFISFEQSGTGGRCTININKSNSAEIIKLLSPEIANYLSALMAPIVTGEEMSKQEYLELIEMFYNKPVSDEIASSRVQASLEFPGTISSIQGGTFSGRRATFDIPLVDLLVLEAPVNLEVRWR